MSGPFEAPEQILFHVGDGLSVYLMNMEDCRVPHHRVFSLVDGLLHIFSHNPDWDRIEEIGFGLQRTYPDTILDPMVVYVDFASDLLLQLEKRRLLYRSTGLMNRFDYRLKRIVPENQCLLLHHYLQD